jgi:hypothetical protein
VGPEDFPADPIWFWWPITYAIASAAAAAHIAGTARRNDVPPARRLVLAGVAVLSTAVPIVPFAIGFGAGCGDTGLGPRLSLVGLSAGFPALVAWAAILWGLYLAAGGNRANEKYPLILFFGVLAGMVLEFPFSMSSMATYCEGSWSTARTHLVVAGGSAGIVASLVLALVRRTA